MSGDREHDIEVKKALWRELEESVRNKARIRSTDQSADDQRNDR